MSTAINTIEDLADIAKNLSGDYHLTRDLDFNDDGSYADPLNKPTYTAGDGWAPIGTDVSKFTGTFDGAGYTISGLFIDRPLEINVGLFGHVGGGLGYTPKIKNVTIRDANVTGLEYVGSLLGRMDTNVSIEDCHAVNVTVEAAGVDGNYAGGLGGYISAATRCSVGNSIVIAEMRAGGFCGETSWDLLITECRVYDTTVQVRYAGAGGFVGYADGANVRVCSAENVTVQQLDATTRDNTVGGFVGTALAHSYFYACYATGAASVAGDAADEGDYEPALGGFVAAWRASFIHNYAAVVLTQPQPQWSLNLWGGWGGYENVQLGNNDQANFFDHEVAGSTNTNGGAPLTTAAAKSLATYTAAGWDIVAVAPGEVDTAHVWNIVDGQDYPFLSWQENPIPAPEMTYSYEDAATRYAGGYNYALEITNGATVRYYSTADLTIPGVGTAHGRILSGGTVDRTLESLRKRPDVTMTLADHDGAISDLFDYDTATANILRSTITLYRGAPDVSWADWQEVAVFEFAELVEIRDDGQATITLRGGDPRPQGRLSPPWELDVLEMLRTEYPTPFSQVFPETGVSENPRVVPFLFGSGMFEGRFSFSHTYAGWPAYEDEEAFNQGGRIAILGLTRWGAVLDQRVTILPTQLGVPILWPSDASLRPGFAQFWLAELNAYVLCLRVTDGAGQSEHGAMKTAGLFNGGGDNPPGNFLIWDLYVSGHNAAAIATVTPASLTPGSLPPSPPIPLPYTIRDVAEAVFELSEDGSWAADAHAASWDAAEEEYSAIALRGAVTEAVSALELLGEIATPMDAWVYQRRDGTTGIAYVPNASTDASAIPVLTLGAEHEILAGARARIPEDGIGAICNVVQFEGIEAYPQENAASIARHNREAVRAVSPKWLVGNDLRSGGYGAITDRLHGIYSDPRWTLDLPLPQIGTILELGDVVTVAPGFLTTWASPRRCIVTRLSEDLDTGTARATVVDFEDAISLKLYRVNDTTDYVVASGSANLVAILTASSDTVRITESVEIPEGVLESTGDILCVRTSDNRFNCAIRAVSIIDTANVDLTLSTLGGGSLPTANESGVVDWEIVRSYANRNDSHSDYAAPSDIYGFLASEATGEIGKDDGYAYGGT